MRNALVVAAIGILWFVGFAIAVEFSTNILSGTTISGFAFLVTRFAIYFAVAFAGAILSYRFAKQLKWPLLVALVLVAGERLTFDYEIYKFDAFTLLNFSIDYVGIAVGILMAWLISRRSPPGDKIAQ